MPEEDELSTVVPATGYLLRGVRPATPDSVNLDIDDVATYFASLGTPLDASVVPLSNTKFAATDVEAGMQSLLGVIDSDNGAVVSGTTSLTTLFAASPMQIPDDSQIGDIYFFAANGNSLNLSGSAGRTSQIRCQLGGTSLWTPFAISMANAQLFTWEIHFTLLIKEADASELLGPYGKFEPSSVVNFGSAPGVDTTLERRISGAPTVATNAAINITLDTTHSHNDAAFTTTCAGAYLTRARRV